MDRRQLRDVFGIFATGVTVVTCSDATDRPHGATVTAFTPISLDPPLVQVSLTRTSRACEYLEGRPFAVNVLAEDQVDIAWHFAGRPMRPAPVVTERSTAPAVEGAVATIICRPWASYDGGDHVLFLGEVVEIDTRPAAPLLFHGSTFKRLGPKLHASAWTGCSDDPDTGWFDATTTFMPAHLTTRASA